MRKLTKTIDDLEIEELPDPSNYYKIKGETVYFDYNCCPELFEPKSTILKDSCGNGYFKVLNPYLRYTNISMVPPIRIEMKSSYYYNGINVHYLKNVDLLNKTVIDGYADCLALVKNYGAVPIKYLDEAIGKSKRDKFIKEGNKELLYNKCDIEEHITETENIYVSLTPFKLNSVSSPNRKTPLFCSVYKYDSPAPEDMTVEDFVNLRIAPVINGAMDLKDIKVIKEQDTTLLGDFFSYASPEDTIGMLRDIVDKECNRIF